MTSSVGIQKHTLPRPEGLIECRTVLDVGAGIRPMQWYTPERHICVEPFGPYCEVLREAGYEVWQGDAFSLVDPGSTPSMPVASCPVTPEAFYLLDVIEHMDREHATYIVNRCAALATTQVVVYTPLGFVGQTTDAWDMGGDYWQTHRSGWTPEDFLEAGGWRTELFTPQGRERPEGFFAIWEPQ